MSPARRRERGRVTPGSNDNDIVFRGDLNGSTRGWHGGSVFLDPSSEDQRYKMIYLGLIADEEWEAFERQYPHRDIGQRKGFSRVWRAFRGWPFGQEAGSLRFHATRKANSSCARGSSLASSFIRRRQKAVRRQR